MCGETGIRPFRADMPSEAVADLRPRVAATRWPFMELVKDRSQGVQRARAVAAPMPEDAPVTTATLSGVLLLVIVVRPGGSVGRSFPG